MVRNTRPRSDGDALPPVPAPADVLPRTPLPDVEEIDWDASGWDELSEPTNTVTLKDER